MISKVIFLISVLIPTFQAAAPSWNVTNYAGVTLTTGYVNGAPLSSQFNNPQAAIFDPSNGNLWIADVVLG